MKKKFILSEKFFENDIIEQYRWFKRYLNLKIKINSNSWNLISQNIQKKFRYDKKIFREVVDNYKKSDQFKSFVYGYKIYEFCEKVLKIKKKNLIISHTNYRLDLNQKFLKNIKKLSLDWHQDYKYFKSKGLCGPNSFVISIPMHDCDKSHGCLAVSFDSDKSLDFHKKIYKAKNKHLRFVTSNPERFFFMETKIGQAQVLNFLTKHRSGDNISSIFRSTILIRVSDKTAKGFKY